VGKNGRHASYSTPGSALFVTAPGGDFELYTNTNGALISSGCAEFGVGTSFSVPIMAGAIALVLEANPNLTWRDVQGILATTSQMIDSTDSTWMVNAGGMHHWYLYGFGLADAAFLQTKHKLLLKVGLSTNPSHIILQRLLFQWLTLKQATDMCQKQCQFPWT
jgi:subtilisin family serine protease